MSSWDRERYLPRHKGNKDHTWADAVGCVWVSHGRPSFPGRRRTLLTANGTDNRAEAEWGRAYHRPSGRLHPERLNSGGTCSDPGIGRRGTGKLGMPAAGTEWTRD